ncbi:MAG TPA: biotin/lipoyl-containing protein [Candidatus Limnocylindrales bacterium]|nr:biotin/lipoyl-containing protein [Candidatus Limnocylindrales bacterium]
MHDDRARQEPRRDRTVDERAADHAAIDRLADELLPALVAKLSATGLGEIEVKEGPWRVRIRRPGDGSGGPGYGRRSTDKASRAQPGHAGHGHAPGAFEGHRSARDAREARPAAAGSHSTNGSSAPRTAVGPGADGASSGDGARAERRPSRTVATSPAVGVYQPKSDATPGTRVRAGDRLGAVDMLGVAQEVVAPADGLIGASLVEAGQAVEYGQELVVIELAGESSGSTSGAGRAGEG